MRIAVQHCPPVSIAETLAGTPGIVDLWHWRYEEVSATTLADAVSAVITPDEHERGTRFRLARDRRLFIATRLLVRSVLSRYAPVAPAEWRFDTGSAGKPRAIGPAVARALYFNLAHTAGLVVCAVSVAHEAIGVDVERTDRVTDYVALSQRWFAQPEALEVRNSAPEWRPDRFFASWTLKESYLKARGVGLAVPLDQFWFSLAGPRIEVTFDPRVQDDETCWHFALVDAPPCHLIAVAAQTAEAPLSLRAAPLILPASRTES